jgi:hypothetical protein
MVDPCVGPLPKRRLTIQDLSPVSGDEAAAQKRGIFDEAGENDKNPAIKPGKNDKVSLKNY